MKLPFPQCFSSPAQLNFLHMKELDAWLKSMRRKAAMFQQLCKPQDVQNYENMGEKRSGRDIFTRTEKIPGKKRLN